MDKSCTWLPASVDEVCARPVTRDHPGKQCWFVAAKIYIVWRAGRAGEGREGR